MPNTGTRLEAVDNVMNDVGIIDHGRHGAEKICESSILRQCAIVLAKPIRKQSAPHGQSDARSQVVVMPGISNREADLLREGVGQCKLSG